MEVTNILQTRTYELNDEEKILIIKKLTREGGSVVNMSIHKFCKRGMLNNRISVCNTKKKFKPQHNETILSLQCCKLAQRVINNSCSID